MLYQGPGGARAAVVPDCCTARPGGRNTSQKRNTGRHSECRHTSTMWCNGDTHVPSDSSSLSESSSASSGVGSALLKSNTEINTEIKVEINS